MSGTLEVKGGTFAVKGGAQFTALSGITVRNGATFSLEDCQNANPLLSPLPIAFETGAKIKIPSGITLLASVIKLDGNPVLEARTYTSATCDWIEGDGSVVYRPVMNDVNVK